MVATYAPGQDFSQKAGIDDAALQQLPRANVRPIGSFDPNEFETIQDVPLFPEHETVARNGRALRFGRDELSAIVERCNRRIRETGDYAAIVIGHTPSPEDKARGAPEPELVGFAGPYRLGIIGQPGERQRYTVLGDMHYFKADLDKVRKHPRRSVELWMEDRYSEMFFDPIALLGAEAPRLDMGLLYSARRSGRIIEKYAAAAPAGGNVFVPSDEIRRYESDPSISPAIPPTSHQGGTMIDPADIKAIVDAVEQLPAMAWAKSQMGAAGAAPGAPPAPAHAPAAPPAPTAPPGPPGMIPPGPGAPPMGAAPAAPHPAPAPAAAAPPAPAPHPPAAPAPAPAPHPPAAGPGPGTPPPAAPKPAAPAGPPSPSANGNGKPLGDAKPEPKKEEEPKKMQAQYAAGDGTGPNADDDYDAAADLEGDGTRDHVIGDAKSRYAAADDMFDDDDDFEQYAAYRKGRMKRYEAASGDVDADSGDPKPAGDATVEGRDGQPPQGSNADTAGEADSSYGGTGSTINEKYSRMAGTVEKYGREIATLRKELDTERASRVNAERHAALVDLRMLSGLLIDPNKLMEKLNYSKVSDAEFKERIDFMLDNGGRVPIGRDLYVPESPAMSTTATGITREKFSKEHSDRALRICEAEALQGKQPVYEDVLSEVRAGKR